MKFFWCKNSLIHVLYLICLVDQRSRKARLQSHWFRDHGEVCVLWNWARHVSSCCFCKPTSNKVRLCVSVCFYVWLTLLNFWQCQNMGKMESATKEQIQKTGHNSQLPYLRPSICESNGVWYVCTYCHCCHCWGTRQPAGRGLVTRGTWHRGPDKEQVVTGGGRTQGASSCCYKLARSFLSSSFPSKRNKSL